MSMTKGIIRIPNKTGGKYYAKVLLPRHLRVFPIDQEGYLNGPGAKPRSQLKISLNTDSPSEAEKKGKPLVQTMKQNIKDLEALYRQEISEDALAQKMAETRQARLDAVNEALSGLPTYDEARLDVFERKEAAQNSGSTTRELKPYVNLQTNDNTLPVLKDAITNSIVKRGKIKPDQYNDPGVDFDLLQSEELVLGYEEILKEITQAKKAFSESQGAAKRCLDQMGQEDFKAVLEGLKSGKTTEQMDHFMILDANLIHESSKNFVDKKASEFLAEPYTEKYFKIAGLVLTQGMADLELEEMKIQGKSDEAVKQKIDVRSEKPKEGELAKRFKEFLTHINNEYEKDRGARLPDTAKEVLPTFLDLVGVDAGMDALNRKNIMKIRSLYERTPTRYSRRSEFKGLGLSKVVELNEKRDEPYPIMTKATINTKIEALRAFAEWYIKIDPDFDNPTYKMKFPPNDIKKQAKKNPNRSRSQHGKPVLNEVFLSELFTNRTPSKVLMPRGNQKIKDAFEYESTRWMLLMVLFTGARPVELCELTVHSVMDIKVLDLDTEQLVNRKFIKIRTAKREDEEFRNIPLHSELIRLGFLDYVEEQNRNGNEMLFPSPGKQAKRNKDEDGLQPVEQRYSAVINHYLAKTGLRKKTIGLTLYSMRHTQADEMRQRGCLEAHVSVIQGKQPVDILATTSTFYGDRNKKIGTNEQLCALIDCLKYDGLEIPKFR